MHREPFGPMLIPHKECRARYWNQKTAGRIGPRSYCDMKKGWPLCGARYQNVAHGFLRPDLVNPRHRGDFTRQPVQRRLVKLAF